MHEPSLCYCTHSVITHSPDRAAVCDPHLLLLLHWVKAMKTAAAVWQQLITRLTRPKRYMKLINYVGMYKKKVGKNAGFCSTHRVLSGKLTVRSEFGFVTAPEWDKFLDSYGMPGLKKKKKKKRVKILLSLLTINSILISCEIAIWMPWTQQLSWETIHALLLWEWIQIMFVIVVSFDLPCTFIPRETFFNYALQNVR